MKFEMSNHIAIQVKGLKKATDFYKDVMGMEILSSGDSEAEIKCGNTIFHVEDSEQGKTFLLVGVMKAGSLPRGVKPIH